MIPDQLLVQQLDTARAMIARMEEEITTLQHLNGNQQSRINACMQQYIIQQKELDELRHYREDNIILKQYIQEQRRQVETLQQEAISANAPSTSSMGSVAKKPNLVGLSRASWAPYSLLMRAMLRIVAASPKPAAGVVGDVML
jgi:hypothetical protein